MKKLMSAAALMVSLALPAMALAGADAPKTTSDTKPIVAEKAAEAVKSAPMKAKEDAAKKVDKTAKAVDKTAVKADLAKDKPADKAPATPAVPATPAK